MNYGDLKTHFKNVLNRSDITEALQVTFIDQGIQRIQRSLRTPLMEKQREYTFSAQSPSIILPIDFLEIMDIYHDTTALQRVPIATMLAYKKNTRSGTPGYFTRENNSLLLYPEPATGTITINYYGEFETMTDDADENNLAAVASDLIIYSALTYAADYYLDERSPTFEAKYVQFMTELQEQANDQELSGTTQQIQPAANY
jgi:hypothetical protein